VPLVHDRPVRQVAVRGVRGRDVKFWRGLPAFTHGRMCSTISPAAAAACIAPALVIAENALNWS